ncbi:MAG: hypothetical protein RID11_05575 [Roseovarius sp.]|jgi:hypothetical protein|uniref:hypothetical protein n=1 Tax=Roseovarius sp. TaxID=1486281 RepID=UPI0032EE282E
MYAISLTSIPPRYARLGLVLESLLSQRPAPDRVLLCLPHRPMRFAPGPWPEVPEGVEILSLEEDMGPASKVLPAARRLAGQGGRLIYCDDDWTLPQGWAARLLAGSADEAVAGSGFDVRRLKRQDHVARRVGYADIAQGFAGVAVRPDWLAGAECTPPPAAWPVDDIWLSAQLARQGIAVRLAPEARAGMCPAYTDAHGLQDAVIDGRDRAAANRACLDEFTARYGLWPPLD